MIQALRSSAHPRNNILSLFTFLWCLWKAMNDSLFKKSTDPCQVFPAANAIMQGSKLEDNVSKQDHQAIDLAKQSLESQQDPFSIAGNVICTDAAWKCGSNQDLAPTVIWIIVIIQIKDNQHCQQIHIAALSLLAQFPLEAEAYGLRFERCRFWSTCRNPASSLIPLFWNLLQEPSQSLMLQVIGLRPVLADI